MIIHSIRLQEFRTHRDTTVHFLERGINAVVGRNGNGKTTILEGISYALYGMEGARGPKSSIRSKRAPARRQAEVTLEFTIAGRRLKVHRTESDATLYEGAEKIARGTSAVNKYLPELIGMSYTEYSLTYMTTQKQLAQLASMKGVEKKQFALSVLGVGKVDDALEVCRKRKNALANEVDGASRGLGDRTELEAEAAAAQAAHEAASTELSGARSEHDAAVAVAADATESLNASDLRRRRHDVATREHASAVERQQLAEAEVDRAVRQLEEARAAAARVSDRELELSVLPELVEQRDALRLARANQDSRAQFERSIENARTELREIERDIIGCQQQMAAYQAGAHEKAEVELTALRGQLANLTDTRRSQERGAAALAASNRREAVKTQRKIEVIEAAGANGDCPTCTRALDEAFDIVLDNLRAELKACTTEAESEEAEAAMLAKPSAAETALSQDIADLESVCTEYRDARALFQSADHKLKDRQRRRVQVEASLADVRASLSMMPAVPFDAAELADAEGEVTRLQFLDRSLQNDRALAARVAGLQKEMSERLLSVAGETAKQIECTQKIRASGFIETDHALATQAANAAQQRREEAAQHTARCEQAVTAAISRLERASSVLAAYDLRAGMLEQLRTDLRTHEQTAARLADFRAALASTIRPEMEALVSGFLSLLTEGRHEAVELTPDFDVVAFESGVRVEVVSGGCEDLIALSLRLAISQMICERAGHPLSLLVLDEAFASLDEIRRAGVLNLIRRLNQVFLQVIVISHIPEIKESADFVIDVAFSESEGRSIVTCPNAARTEQAETVAA